MRIFIADDSKKLINSLIDVLNDIQGVTICGQAYDVPTAIEGILAQKPDLVILDIRMPGGSGLDVLKRVKQTKAPPIVVIFSDFTQSQYRTRYLESGADQVFRKSLDTKNLTDLIRQYRIKYRDGHLPPEPFPEK